MIEKIRFWQALDREMELVAVWNPNEEQDPWVRYRDTSSQQEYTCRLEAFQSRFTPRLD
jgi:hypothetical protein